MDEFESLSHTKWDCKYHVVFIPKCRRKTLYGQLRQHLGEVFKKLAAQKESRIEEGHLMVDHVHMILFASFTGGFHAAVLGASYAVDARSLDAGGNRRAL